MPRAPRCESCLELDLLAVAAQGIAVNEQGRVRVDGGLEYQTSNSRVFAGGDNVRGADLVVTAVRDGRDAGLAIARYLAELPSRVPSASAQCADA